MDDFQAKQEDELMVLQSIYSSNFLDLREIKNGKKKPNPIFKITLFPLNSESQHELNHFYVQIDLKIKFGPEYPNEPPIIILENDKGLSQEQVKSLHKQLVNKAHELKGGEMVYQLSQVVSEFLYANNKPPTKSFYEQRLENNIQLEMQKLQESYYEIENTKIDDQLFAKIHQAVDEKKKMLQLERKKERELEKRERLSSNNSPSRSRSCKSEHENGMGDLENKNNFQSFVVEFKEPVQLRIKCFKLIRTESQHSFSLYRGIETYSDEIYNIYEWKICLEKNKIFEQKKLDLCLMEMNKIEAEFRRLSRFNSNSLVKYIAYRKEVNRNIFIIQICLEYIEGNSIEMFLSNQQCYIVSESMLKSIINQLLDSLEFLHSNSLVHRDLKASCIHMKDNSLEIKLSDYEIVKKLNNLNELVSNDAVNVSSGSAKWDIHQMGLLVLSLFLGEKIESFHTQVPNNLPPELKSFINYCFKQSDKVNCKFLREHPFMKKISEPSVRQNNSSIIKRTSSVHYHDDDDEIKSFTDYSSQSRLNKEFDVIGMLGHGAYGEVLKVKNKLDQRSYAIKRIRINPNSKHYNKLITREIKLLSRLNHENVVRYYSTWVEQDTEEFKENDQDCVSIDDDFKDLSDFKDFSDFSDEVEENSDSKKEALTPIESESDFDFEPASLSSQSSEESIGKSLHNKKVTFSLNNNDESDDSVIFAENSSENVKKKSTKKSVSNKNCQTKKPEKCRQYIFIQMEYCGGKTLKDLIDNGLYRNEDKVWVLFREILQGLNHIHEQGMIHRDLKPSNVLIDLCGHAKIGDFGLATSRFKMQKEHITAPGMCDIALEDNAVSLSLTHVTNPTDSLQHDSQCLSGAVGTALYVAPELMIPYKKNKYMYSQKVDIYSLGIVFYEMCFPFSTIMERISVLQKLRLKDAEIKSHIGDEKKDKQLSLIKLMLDHDPSIRPSAKQLLLNESIPRKEDEIALEELLEYSFKNKQSTNFKRIFKAIFDQKCSLIDDASFYATHAKNFGSLRLLQIRECVHTQLVRIFQNHGGYMLNYPLLTPCTEFFDYNKAYRLTDDCGLVLCLAYNHRIPFAKCLAGNCQTNLKRYHIGKVFTEKMKLSGQHPREYLEASFDIISASNSDCLPEIEILSVMNDVINSFNELSSQNYVLVINNSFLLNAILDHCRIAEFDQKKVYYLLSEYNNKLIKSSNATRENRAEWLNGRLPHLNMNESTIEKLLNFLLKSGGSEKILSEMKTLTKSDNNWSKLAKEAIRQMKLILDNIKIMDIKIPIVFSPAFVLPVILHPSDYSGFIFQLQVRRKNKNEFDILASGGRYDSLISKFANRPTNNQRAVGISFDFEKIVSLISEKSGHKFFRSEVVVCSIGDIITNQSNIIQSNSTNSINSLVKSKKNTIKQETSVVSTSMLESKNKLRLYKQLLLLNSNFGISTHMIHEKFSNTEEMDDYCKKACINSYSYINDNSVLLNSKIVANNQPSLNSLVSDSNAMEPTETSASSKIFLSIRSWIDRGFRFMEKEFNLNDFMAQSNQIINSISSIGSTNFANSNLQLISSPIANSLLGSGGLNTTRRVSSSSNQSYMDLVNSMLSPQSSSLNPLVSSSSAVPTSSASATNLNCMSQLNVTLLLEPANRQQTNSNVNRKKLEQQVIGKLGQVFSIFSARTRIDLVVIETHENVIQILANHLHLEQDKTCFHNNWNICMEKINNKKLSRQLNNFRLGEILYELRYVKKSKVFIIYGYKSDQYKLLVAA